jgi:hypothetical protein
MMQRHNNATPEGLEQSGPFSLPVQRRFRSPPANSHKIPPFYQWQNFPLCRRRGQPHFSANYSAETVFCGRDDQQHQTPPERLYLSLFGPTEPYQNLSLAPRSEAAEGY